VSDLPGKLRDAITAAVDGVEPSIDLMTAARRRHRRRQRRFAIAGPLAAMMVIAPAIIVAGHYAQSGHHLPAPSRSRLVPIYGSGSSWAAVAIDQWAQDMRPSGLVVNFNPDGSAAGRADYMANRDDFAASEPPFRSAKDKLGGVGPEHPRQGYSYAPDAGGATAFPYHITINGHLVTNLRLAPRTLVGIFTGQITNWDSPQITRDYGSRLPNLPITVVLHAEGDGGTYLFTRWMASQYPHQWNAFCERVHPGLRPPCGPTEFYPVFGHAKAENGSNNVVTYIASPAGNGAIGYAEFAYALNDHLPVAALRNPAGRYVLPTARNVSTALTQAIIDMNAASKNFLQQDLDKVYTYANVRSYPLASYSYLIVPRSGTRLPSHFTKAKGRALSAFLVFALCRGQRQLPSLGYVGLPPSMIAGALEQAAHIPGHGRIPSLPACAGKAPRPAGP
jgi:ABC-type phosphate transport system substrate-binding protein